MTLKATQGTLSLWPSAIGSLDFLTGTGTNDGTMVFVGTVDNINAALNGMNYKPNANYAGTDTLSITANDQSSPTPGSDTQTVAITVTNTAPGITLPSTQSMNLNSTLTVTPNITITDAEAGTTSPLRVTLSVTHGTMTLSQTIGLNFLTGTGTADTAMQFAGTLANINAAIKGLTYAPSTDYVGKDTLSINVNDQVVPTPGTTSQTIEVTVYPGAGNITINPPTPDPIAVAVNLTSHITGLSIEDSVVFPDPTAANPYSNYFTVMVAVDHGKLATMEAQTTVTESNSGTIITQTNFVKIGPNSQLTFRGPLQYVNISLAGLMYTPDEKYQGATPPPYPDTLYVTVVDPLLNTAAGNYDFTIANAFPTISPSTKTVDAYAGVSTAITGITVGDADIGSTKMSVTVSATYGTLTVPSETNVTGNGTNTLIINDILTNVNLQLAGLRYLGTYIGTDHVIINANDQTTPTPGVANPAGDITVTVSSPPVPASSNPVVTVPGAQTLSENSSLAIPGISVYDADIGTSGLLTVTLTVNHGTITVQVPATTPGTTPTVYTSSIVTFTDTLVNVNTALAGLIYTPNAKYDSTDTLTITAVDQSPNPGSDTGSIGISVTNVAPTITAPATATVTTSIAGAITGVSVSDSDIGATNIAVTLSVKYGVLGVPSSTNVTGNGTSTVVINDTLANVNTQLAGLRYYTSLTTPDVLSITADDQSTPTPGTGSASVNITVTALPDPSLSAPVITVPGAQTLAENTSLAINGISVYDADIGTTGQITVTLEVLHGTVTVQVPATTPGTTPATYTSSIVTFTDTLTNVNTALAGLIYTPTAKYDSTDTLTITAVDQSPSPLSDTKTIAITVTNTDPTITAPATATAVTYTSTAITGISMADPDIATTNMSVTLSVGYGVLTLPSSTNVTGNGTSTVIITDTLANVNSQLSGLRYTSNSGFTGIDTLSMTANDLSTPTAGTDSNQVAITVTTAPTPIASPPTINAPTVLSVKADTTLPIQFGASNPISVQYADTTKELRVTLTANNGYITLGWKGHLNSYVGDGTLKVNFTGPLTAINEALYGLKYAPVHNYFDTTDDTMTIRVDDQAGQVTSQTMAINVYSVNDPPVVTVPGVQSVSVNTPKVISGVSVADPDVGAGSLKMTLGALHGNLSVTGVGPSADITFTDTLANVNTLLGTLTYRPVSGYWGPDWITVTVNDQGNSGSGGAMSDTKKVTVRVGVY